MADNDEFDNDNDGQNANQGSGKGLRAQLEAALEELKSIKDERDALAAKTRVSDLATLLKANKAREGAEKLYPKDAEVSEAAVKAWVEENAAFVRDESASDETQDDGVSDETKENGRRLSKLADLAVQRTEGDLNNVIEQMKAAKTPEELSAIYQQIGLKRD